MRRQTVDLTCQLYIDGAENLDDLADHILKVTSAKRSGRTLSTPMFDIDLEISLDHNPSHLESLGGFLFWPYGAYLEPTSDAISERQYIASVSALIADLRKRNLRVVASCDFEKEVSQITGWNWSEGSPIHPVH